MPRARFADFLPSTRWREPGFESVPGGRSAAGAGPLRRKMLSHHIEQSSAIGLGDDGLVPGGKGGEFECWRSEQGVEHDGNLGKHGPNLARRLHPVHSRHAEIHDDQIGFALRSLIDGGAAILRLACNGPVFAGVLNQFRDSSARTGMIVCN